MQHHGHLALTPEVYGSLLKMSAATIDRVLAPQREHCGRRRRRPGSAMTIRRSIPVRTFSDWNDPARVSLKRIWSPHSGPTPVARLYRHLC